MSAYGQTFVMKTNIILLPLPGKTVFYFIFCFQIRIAKYNKTAKIFLYIEFINQIRQCADFQGNIVTAIRLFDRNTNFILMVKNRAVLSF